VNLNFSAERKSVLDQKQKSRAPGDHVWISVLGILGELSCGILGGAVLCEFQPSLRHDQEHSL
jgi:hypothetical protein